MAATVLGEIKDERAVEPLIDALHDNGSKMQSRAVTALGRIGDERAVESLIDALHANGSKMQSRAAMSLGEIKDERAVGPLIDVLQDNNSSVRSSAVTALKHLCGSMHRGKLEPLLKSENNNAANMAFEILHSIKLKEREKVKIFKELKYLLRLDSIPGNDSAQFTRYLLEDHGITWAERAEIHKSDDMILTIFKDENSAGITIDEKGKKSDLKT